MGVDWERRVAEGGVEEGGRSGRIKKKKKQKTQTKKK